MKRIASILLLGILCFNWFGYRLLSDILQQQANKALETRLDQHHYDESQLLEMRVPLAMPYQSDWSGFERCDGEIEINGIHYKYVKRKVENGQLVLLCLPNETKMRLQSARDDFYKLVNDLRHPSSNKKSDSGHSFSSITTEYSPEKNNWSLAGITAFPVDYTSCNAFFKTIAHHLIPEQPPESAVVS